MGRATVRVASPLFQPLTYRRGTIHGARIAPDGQTIAYSVGGGPDGREVWFTASESGAARTLYAVDRDGRRRELLRLPLRLTLHDVSRDGRRVLLTDDRLRRSIAARAHGAERERDLSWMDYSNAKDLSADGRTLLFSEDGEAGRSAHAVYLRGIDGSPAVRLGEGTSLAPDGRQVLSILVHTTPHRLTLLPAGAGQPRTLPAGDLVSYTWASWMPDGRRVVLAGARAGEGTRLHVQDVEGGAPRPLGTEEVDASFGALLPSHDGTLVAAIGPGRLPRLHPVAGGEPLAVPGVGRGRGPRPVDERRPGVVRPRRGRAARACDRGSIG